MFFKYGLMGLILVTALYLYPGWKVYKILKQVPFLLGGVAACLIAFLPTCILSFYWTGKGVFLSGIVIAILYSLIEQCNAFVYTNCCEEPDDESEVLAAV